MRGRSFTAFLWIVGVCVYAAFIVYIGWRPIVESLTRVQAMPLALMVLVTIAALWVRVLKWRAALGPDADASRLFWLSKAAGEWSPGRIGELSPLLLDRYRTPRVAAWIVVDRAFEIACTLSLGVAGVILVQTSSKAALIGSAALIAAAMVFALLLLSWRELFEHLRVRTSEGSRLNRLFRFLAETSSEVAALRSRSALPLAITLVAGLADVWAGMLLFAAFGHNVTFAVMAAVKGLHAITSAIPITPNATGIPYLTAAILLHEVAHVPSEVLAAAIALSVAISNIIFWVSASAALATFRRNP